MLVFQKSLTACVFLRVCVPAAFYVQDHGVVHNSAAAAGVDQPVLHAELDVELMAEELADFTSGTRTFRRVGTDEDEW